MQNEANRLWTFGAQILTVFLVFVGLIGQRNEFRSERPPVGKEKPVVEDEIFIRLPPWEDPFEALPEDDPKTAPAINDAVQNRAARERAADDEPKTPQVSVAGGSADSSGEIEALQVGGATPGTTSSREKLGNQKTKSEALIERGFDRSPIPTAESHPGNQKLPEGSNHHPKDLGLIVLVEGGKLPGARELRRRARYAIETALLTSGYRAALRNRLCRQPKNAAGPAKGGTDNGRKNVPLTENVVCEEYQRDAIGEKLAMNTKPDQKFDRVFVFWANGDRIIAEDILRNEVAEAFRNVPTVIDPDPEEAEKKNLTQPVKLLVFDLGRSDRLVAFETFMKSARKTKGYGGDDGGFSFFQQAYVDVSFMMSTLSKEQLGQAIDDPAWEARSKRPVATDDVLVYALVRELGLRLPILASLKEPKGSRDDSRKGRIVLVTECNTIYGRGIAWSFREALNDRYKGAPIPRIYTYLSGLDGRAEDAHDEGQKRTTATGGAVDALRAIGTRWAVKENSVGSSQFDYLRRFAVRLRREEKDEGRVLAVGILGSDVYDKLLVMQALRPELPEALFFTTELDALYLQAENLDTTRNLIVASATGLDVDQTENVDWSVPPMRDNYQTSLFRTMRDVINTGKIDTIDPGKAKVQVYEIGAGREVRVVSDLKKPDTVPPDPIPGEPVLGWLANPLANAGMFVFGLANALIVLAALCFREKGDVGDPPALRPLARQFVQISKGISVAGILFFGGLLLAHELFPKLFAKLTETPDVFAGEPLSWSLGVSIWPTILIRLIALLVALELLEMATGQAIGAQRNMRAANKDFLEKAAANPGGLTRGWAKENALLRSSSDDIEEQFSYVAAWAVVYLAAAILLFSLFPPSVPGRGAFAMVLEKVVVALGVGMYVVHLLYCVVLHWRASNLLAAIRLALSDPELSESVNEYELVRSVGAYTASVGKTLLFPLTVLVIIMLSRIRLFDAWSMTPGLWITLGVGAVTLLYSSIRIVGEAQRLRNVAVACVEDQTRKLSAQCAEQALTAKVESEIPDASSRSADKISTDALGRLGAATAIDADSGKLIESKISDLQRRSHDIREMSEGAFAPWYRQPIFGAFVSLFTVLGTVGYGETVVRLFVG